MQVMNVAVSDVMPPESRPGGGSDGEFEIEGDLRVDDAFFLIEPFVMPAESFDSITGILQFRDQRHKLMPRTASDYIAGAPSIARLEPALSFARIGAGQRAHDPDPAHRAPDARDGERDDGDGDGERRRRVGGRRRRDRGGRNRAWRSRRWG